MAPRLPLSQLSARYHRLGEDRQFEEEEHYGKGPPSSVRGQVALLPSSPPVIAPAGFPSRPFSD
ncbi:hypothetical protein C8Q80DRAFT_946465 [Daedaleopsis nitida]|nr:hypothetical protein C8Q80DRAFT_946465 [Daedaleopsis nitida]